MITARRVASTLFSLALAIGLLAALPTAAQAADNWAPVVDLSATGQNATSQQIALSADGTRATAVWLRSNGTNNIIQTASATINGSLATWGPVSDLSATGQNATVPQIGLSADGTRATAVWYRRNGTINIIQAASAAITGTAATWGTVTDLSATGQNAINPQIGLSSDGTRATAVWSRFNGTNNIIQAASATITGTAATWGTATDLSATGQNATTPQVALSADGTRATAIWYRFSGTNQIIQTASATITGNAATWGTVTDLSATGQNATNPQVALSADGTRATTVWSRSNGTNNIMQTASATITGNTATWGTVTDLSATGQNAATPQVALSADGTRATTVWSRLNGTNFIIQAASATITGNTATWGTVTDLSATGRSAISPQIGLSSDGTRATATWFRSNGTNDIVQAASATITGNTATWGTVTDLSATGRNAANPQIGLSADGTRATAIWFRSNGINTIIQSKSAMMFVPAAPTVEFAGDTLTITPAVDPGGSPVTEYQINYTTQARIDTGKASAVWATFWPLGTTAINLGTYRTAAACTPVAATATLYPGRCARALGEQGTGQTFVYQVAAINNNGRGAFTNLTVTR